MNEKTNFYKWLVFSFPYLVLLFHKILVFCLFQYWNFEMNSDTDDLVLTLLNSTAILLGIKMLSGNISFRNISNELKEKNQLK